MKRMYFLIADDNNFNRLILKIILEKHGFLVDEAEDGKDVLEKIKGNNDKYSLIWMDLEMPNVDGLDCTKQLRKLNYQGVIIGVTGHVDKESLSECLKSGMDDVLTKPILEENMLKMIKLYTHKN
jgi:CheY-like chemotaxis protein